MKMAIARLHCISPEAVQQYGWPHFLTLRGNAVLGAPWTAKGSLDALGSLRWTAAPATRHPNVTGQILAGFLHQATTAVAAAPLPVAGRTESADADLIEARASDVAAFWLTGDPLTAYQFARAELDLITTLLGEPRGHPAWSRLLLAAAHHADLCAVITGILGDYAAAERYSMLAVRTAASAGSVPHTAFTMAELAAGHARGKDPRDAFVVNAATRSVIPRPAPRLSAVLSANEAQAQARLGNTNATLRALDSAAGALTAGTGDGPLWCVVDEQWLSHSRGEAMYALGLHSKALEHFDHLLKDAPSPPFTTQPPLYTALALQLATRVQLQLGEIDAAVHTARRTAALFHRMPSGLAQRERRMFEPHRRVPSVREFLEFHAEATGV
ncbi:hypothetical protein AB0M92_23975 [Streptomyces sp. NPDC051582]|uniref:hypothetical protein n=1 Tax=Streptomyces sp. NPDC051582 TaxID=3155167 RepID=UPI00341EC2C8